MGERAHARCPSGGSEHDQPGGLAPDQLLIAGQQQGLRAALGGQMKGDMRIGQAGSTGGPVHWGNLRSASCCCRRQRGQLPGP